FQAEDGIRDRNVTGVQTCALPISRSGRDVGQMEFADGLVVASELALALENMDFDAGLIVRSGRKDFRLTRRDGRVSLDEPGIDRSEERRVGKEWRYRGRPECGKER